MTALAIQATRREEADAYPPIEDSVPESTVPARARVAIKALVAHWFEHRPAGDVSQVHETPMHVARLIAGLRVWGAT